LKDTIGKPVYFYKSYEMRKDGAIGNQYFPAELRESKHYTFKEITWSDAKNIDSIKKTTKYTIDNKFTVIA
jgi:hypothetical protein